MLAALSMLKAGVIRLAKGLARQRPSGPTVGGAGAGPGTAATAGMPTVWGGRPTVTPLIPSPSAAAAPASGGTTATGQAGRSPAVLAAGKSRSTSVGASQSTAQLPLKA